jgi:hypothetical protein
MRVTDAPGPGERARRLANDVHQILDEAGASGIPIHRLLELRPAIDRPSAGIRAVRLAWKREICICLGPATLRRAVFERAVV